MGRKYSNSAIIPFPSYLSEVVVKMVTGSLLIKHIFLSFGPQWCSSPWYSYPCHDFLIMKVTMDKQFNPIIEFEKKITGIDNHIRVFFVQEVFIF